MSGGRLYQRCRHCGLAHVIGVDICEVTGERLNSTDGISRPRTSITQKSKRRVDDEYIGRILGGRYRPVRLIGEGGSAAVYDCEDMKSGLRVALKLPHRSYISRRSSLRRFYQEARVVKEINHPKICQLLDMGQLENGVPFLVMELLRGETLEDRLARLGPMGFAETCLVGMHVLEPLAFAHNAGMIHQDVKPGNIFLCRGGAIKLLDFGLSKKAFSEPNPKGHFAGTPLYLAPEQLAGRRLDCAVDIYAVGIVLLECLYGHPPFYARAVDDLLREIQMRGPVPVHVGRPDTPADLAAAIEFAVDRRPSRRYARASDFYDVLETLHRNLGGERPPDLVRTLPAPPIRDRRSSTSPSSDREPFQDPLGRRRDD